MTRALDALAARDAPGESAGFRAAARFRSKREPGMAVLAIAVATLGGEEPPPLRARADLSTALDALLPIEPERVIAIESRWIPDAPERAFDLTTLRATFPELDALE